MPIQYLFGRGCFTVRPTKNIKAVRHVAVQHRKLISEYSKMPSQTKMTTKNVFVVALMVKRGGLWCDSNDHAVSVLY